MLGGIVQPLEKRRRRRALEDHVSLPALESTTWRPALCRLLVAAHSSGGGAAVEPLRRDAVSLDVASVKVALDL